MAFETIRVDDDGPVRTITIARPEVLNALNGAVLAELAQAIEAAGEGSGVRGLVLTGEGKAFVAGADIAAMAEMTPEEALVFAGRGHAVGEMLEALPFPVLAAVNGFALGGGCELALACDFIYASHKAKFGQPEVNLGVIPGFGGTQRLLRRVGTARALELCTTGAIIKADEALAMGLVNRVLEPEALMPTALETMKTIASKGPQAVAKAKELIYRGAHLPLDEANDLEKAAFAEMFTTADQREGMAAFLAKRPAQFQGK